MRSVFATFYKVYLPMRSLFAMFYKGEHSSEVGNCWEITKPHRWEGGGLFFSTIFSGQVNCECVACSRIRINSGK